MLSVLSEYIPRIPPVNIDGIYGNATKAAVLAAQRRFALPETGVVDARTWDEIYDQYTGIENTTLRSEETFPVNGVAGTSAGSIQSGAFSGSRPGRRATVPAQRPNGGTGMGYRRRTTFTQFPGSDLRIGSQDPVSQEVVR